MKHTELPLDLHADGRIICCSSYPRNVGEIEVHSNQDLERARELASFFVGAAKAHDKMVEALKFYADKNSYYNGAPGKMATNVLGEGRFTTGHKNDDGEIARAALAQLPESPEANQ